MGRQILIAAAAALALSAGSARAADDGQLLLMSVLDGAVTAALDGDGGTSPAGVWTVFMPTTFGDHLLAIDAGGRHQDLRFTFAAEEGVRGPDGQLYWCLIIGKHEHAADRTFEVRQALGDVCKDLVMTLSSDSR